MSRIIEIDELMDLAAIDGDFNQGRVKSWQDAAEAEIISFTGLDFDDRKYPDSKISMFLDVARVFVQERVRENFLAPNYVARGIDGLKIRLSLMADELKAEVGDGGTT